MRLEISCRLSTIPEMLHVDMIQVNGDEGFGLYWESSEHWVVGNTYFSLLKGLYKVNDDDSEYYFNEEDLMNFATSKITDIEFFVVGETECSNLKAFVYEGSDKNEAMVPISEEVNVTYTGD